MIQSEAVNWPFCCQCHNHYQGFCRCQATVILAALLENEVQVPLGHANQSEVNGMRNRLHAAALAKWPNTEAVPMEILTRADGSGNVSLVVRRFR